MEDEQACPACGVLSRSVHSRKVRAVKDAPHGRRPLRVRWDQRRWACRERQCSRRTFAETSVQVGRGQRLTRRLRGQLEQAVSGSTRSAADVAREYAVSWWSVNTALVVAAASMLPRAPCGVRLLGVDETRARSVRWLLAEHGWRRSDPWMYLPWSDTFSWIPPSPGQAAEDMNGYFQGDHNPDYVNVVRELPAIKRSALQNPLLERIIQFDYAQTRWSDADLAWPIHVGVHLIKLSVSDDSEAASSPNELHQDGEPFVFAHLMYRSNASGGRNVVATPAYRGQQPEAVPPSDLLGEFELTEPLESYGIYDSLVSHYVGPVRRDSPGAPGERAVILTDFVPMRQSI